MADRLRSPGLPRLETSERSPPRGLSGGDRSGNEKGRRDALEESWAAWLWSAVAETDGTLGTDGLVLGDLTRPVFFFTGTLRDRYCKLTRQRLEPGLPTLDAAVRARFDGGPERGFLVADQGIRGRGERRWHHHCHGLFRATWDQAAGVTLSWERRHGMARLEVPNSTGDVAAYCASAAGYALKARRDGWAPIWLLGDPGDDVGAF